MQVTVATVASWLLGRVWGPAAAVVTLPLVVSPWIVDPLCCSPDYVRLPATGSPGKQQSIYALACA